MGGKSDGTIRGYKYYFGIHMGIGRGPVDQLVEVRVGDRTAWPLSYQLQVGSTEMEDGSLMPNYVTVPSAPPIEGNGLMWILAPQLFGGDEQEGGIVGFADVMMGGRDQPVNSRMVQMLGSFLIPAWRGVFTFFYDGVVATLNPYPKPWKFRVRRALKGWFNDECWYPEKALMILCGDIWAMNPAHIIYEAATNPEWGRGLPKESINEESFVAAANKLAEECFGLCLKWARENDISAFVNQVINHIGAALYPDRRTGKLTLRLLRDDYVPEDLPMFTYGSGLLSIIEEQAASSEPLRNEIIVKWRDPPTDEARANRVQNIASLQQMGAASSETVSYPGIPTEELALRVAQRDLRAKGLTLRRYKLTLDRRGADLAPGTPFRISSPQDGIENTVLRVGKIEDSTQNKGEIVVTAVQDVFGLPNVSYIAPSAPGPTTTEPPEPPVYHRAIEVPYGDIARFASAADLDYLDDDVGFMMALAAKPNDFAINFNLWSVLGVETWTLRSVGDFCPHGLINPISAGAGIVTLNPATLKSLVVVGEALMIEDEIVRINAFDPITGTASISRGCFDTIPAAHGAVSAYAYQRFNGKDPREYVTGDVVKARFATVASSGVINPADAPESIATMNRRFFRVYPPGKVQVNGAYFWEVPTIVGDLTVTWAHRNRIVQDDQLVGHTEASFTPEVGTTYTIRVFDAADMGTHLREVTGITAAEWLYNATDSAADGDVADIVIELWAERDGIASLQKYSFPVRHLPAGSTGYGIDYSENFGG
jgi:hypothetical protein